MGMKVNGSTGLIFPDSTTMATGSQAVKAWVNFNGTGTVAIRASYNVSSITDLGTGAYRVNFTTAMPDTSYAAFASAGTDTGGAAIIYNTFYNEAHTTAGFRFVTTTTGGTDTDYAHVMAAVLR